MDSSYVRVAFEKVAGHITNLEEIKRIVDELVVRSHTLESSIKSLERMTENAEVTLKTDIRILINECRHLKTG